MFDNILAKLQEPLLIEPAKLSVLVDVVMQRKGIELLGALPAQGEYGVPFGKLSQDAIKLAGFTPAQESLYWRVPLNVTFPAGSTNAVIVPIMGTLVARSSGFGGSGATSYSAIKSTLQACIAEGFTNILLHFGTPGGDAQLVWELADYIYGLQQSGIARIGSYTDTSATSAGQLLQAATSMRMAHETATLGSIGAVMYLLNTTKADEKDGYTYDVYKTGLWKDLGNPHRLATEAEQARLQTLVDSLGTQFFARMETYTGKPAEHFKKMEAGLYRGAEVIDLGLATELGNFEMAVDWLLTTGSAKPAAKSGNNSGATKMTDEVVNTPALDATAIAAQAETALLGKVAAIQTAGITYGMTQEFISEVIQQNLTTGMAEQMFKAVASQKSQATAIIQVAAATPTAPVVEPIKPSTLAERLASIGMTAASSQAKGAN